MFLRYKTARLDVFLKQGESAIATDEKDVAVAFQRMLNSQYIQVFNFHIDQKIFPASYRSFYGIAVNSAVVPDQNTEFAVATLTQNIIDGEAAMIIAGGTAIPFPTVINIKAHGTVMVAKNKAHIKAMDAFDLARESILAMNPEAGTVVKKVWDEIESFFDESTIESKRKNSRLWGVVYENVGAPIEVLGHVVEIINGASIPLIGVNALVVETEDNFKSGPEGLLSLKISAIGTATIRLTMDGFADKDIVLELDTVNNIDLGVVVMVRLIR